MGAIHAHHGLIMNAGPPPPAIKWNPADKGTNVSLSNSDLTMTNAAAVWNSVRTLGGAMTSGKWYDEALITGGNGTLSVMFGVCTAGYSMSTYVGATTGGFGLQGQGASGVIRTFLEGTVTDRSGTIADGERGAIAVDIDAGKGWMKEVGGAWIGGGDPAAGTSPTFTFTPGTTLYFAGSGYSAPAGSLTRVGGSYLDSIPSGFTGVG